MEKTFISKEELDELKREIEGLKSTIEVLQDKETMDEIRESERLEKEGVKPRKFNI